jgi:hypothetical protein
MERKKSAYQRYIEYAAADTGHYRQDSEYQAEYE